jgi:hypothetical protein
VSQLVEIEEWPYVLILTSEEERAVRSGEEVSISMFSIDSELLRLYYGEV